MNIIFMLIAASLVIAILFLFYSSNLSNPGSMMTSTPLLFACFLKMNWLSRRNPIKKIIKKQSTNY